MIFDDTSILDELSNEENKELPEGSLAEGSFKEKRNNKIRDDYFNKYKFMYSGTNNNQPASIDSLKGTGL